MTQLTLVYKIAAKETITGKADSPTVRTVSADESAGHDPTVPGLELV